MLSSCPRTPFPVSQFRLVHRKGFWNGLRVILYIRKCRWPRGLRFAVTALALAAAAGCRSGDEIDVVGTLAWDRIELTAEASEPIVAVPVHEGGHVDAGQVILKLDPARVQAQLDQARALAAQSAARLAELERGPRVESIEQARADLLGKQGALDAAQHELERVQSVVARKLSSAQALDDARSAYAVARAARAAAGAALEQLENGTTKEELNQARAARAAADAAVRTLEVGLDRLTVIAPRAGVIDDLPLLPGERPAAGAVVAVLLTGDAPYARVYLPEPLRVQAHVGMAASVYVDGVDRPFAGHVRRVSSDPAFTPYYSLSERDRSRLSYLTEVALDGDAARQLPAGVPLRVVLQTPNAQSGGPADER